MPRIRSQFLSCIMFVLALLVLLAMAEASAKRPKLNMQLLLLDFGRKSVSDRAFSKIITQIASKPEVVEHLGNRNPNYVRSKIGESLLQQFDACASSVKCDDFELPVLNPQRTLQLFADRCPGFRHLVTKTFQTHSLPFNIILYHDELTPGNVLRPDNKRKVTAYYWTFKELDEMIRSEHVWLPLALVRHTVAQDIAGGLSATTAALLRHLFVGDQCFSTGFVLKLPQPVMCFAKLSNFVADESAIKQTWGVKGSAGLKPCFLCKNVVMKGSELLPLDKQNYLVEICEADVRNFDMCTNQELWSLSDHIIAQKQILNIGNMDKLQKNTGMVYNPRGILADRTLREHCAPVDHSTFDSMHCYYSHGAAAVEMNLFLEACAKKANLRFAQFEAFCKADWRISHHAVPHAGAVFSASREKAWKDAGSFKGMASELLAVYPLVRKLSETVLAHKENMQLELASFRCMHEIVNLLQKIKDSCKADDDLCKQLQAAQRKHLKLFVEVYGTEHVLPKHHFSLHIPQQIKRDGLLLDTFVLERKHRVVKAEASLVASLHKYERSVLARVLQSCITEMPDSFEDRLIGSETTSEDVALVLGVPTAVVSEKMRFRNFTIAVDDVIISHDNAMVVLMCVRAGTLMLLVKLYRFLRTDGGYGSLWRPCHRKAIFDLLEGTFHQPTHWSFTDEGDLLTL